jgi:alanine racemase
LILYGLTPSDEVGCNDEFKAVMSLKSVVSHIKEIGIGDTVSYGCDFVADRTMRIATVPMGYADGFERSNAKNNVFLTVKGKKAPIIGRICMDQLMLDVTGIEDVKLGDEVTVFGNGENCNSADDIASANGTINYEVVCSVGKRVPRVFVKDGKIENINLGLLDTSFN